MANVLVEESSLQAIADAIRTKNGTQNTYKPGQMGGAIEAIPTGSTPTGTINITANGTHDVTNYASANVNVPTGVTPTGTKQISITQNGTTTEDVTNYASAEITVDVPTGGGGSTYHGTFTPEERTAVYDFYAPGCTYIAIIATSPPSTTTGLGFVYGCVGYVNRYYAAQSTNTGTNIAGANDTGKITYSDDTFHVNFGNSNTSKTPQVGITYAWCAW